MRKIKVVEKLLIAIPLVVIGIIFRDALFYSALYYEGDTLLNFLPYFNFAAKNGPVLSYQILSGFPVAATLTGIWFYPIGRFLMRLFDPITSYSMIIIFNFVLTVFWMYAYSRKIKMTVAVSVLTSLVFTFSGQLMLWGTTLLNTNYFFILPAALYFLECARQNKNSYLYLFLTGAVLGLGWLSGHPQFVVYIHAFVAFYYFYFIVRERPQKRMKYAAYLVGIFAVSAAIGSFQVYPSYSFISESARSGGVPIVSYIGAGYLPQDLMHYVLPFWDPPLIHTAEPNLYLGIVPLLLLVFAIRHFRKVIDPHFRFYFWAFLFCFASAIFYSPLGALLHALPVFNLFRGAARIMFIGNFAAAMMIGLLLERFFIDGEVFALTFQKYLRLMRNVFVSVVLPCIGIVTVATVYYSDTLERFTLDFFMRYRYVTTTQLPLEHYRRLIHEYVSGSLADLSIFSRDVIVLLIFSVFGYLVLKKFATKPSRSRMVAIVLITALNFAAVYGNHFVGVSRAEVLKPPATARFIHDHTTETPARVFSLFSGIAEFNELDVRCKNPTAEDRLELEKELLMPNINMLYDIESIDGYENFMPRRMAQLLSYVGSDRAVSGTSLAHEKIPLEERIRKFMERKNILRMMNVKYIISPFVLSDADFGEVFRESVGRCKTDVYIYELSDVWPRAFFTNSYTVVPASDELDASRLSDLQNAVATGMVLLDQGAAQVTGSETEKILKEASLIQGNDTVSLSVDAPTDGIVYISYTWLPHWKAFLDGRPVPLLKANEVYMAVVVSRGQHTIELRYSFN